MIAFRRLTIRKSPTSIVDSATGTISDEAAAPGKRQASAQPERQHQRQHARPGATAGSPTNGSTSRRTFGLPQHARQQPREHDRPSARMVTSGHGQPRGQYAAVVQQQRQQRPGRCPATPRCGCTTVSRLEPSSSRSVISSRHHHARQSASFMTVTSGARTRARADSAPAPTSSRGTRTSRSRAMHGFDHAHHARPAPTIPRTADAGRLPDAGRPDGHEQADDQRPEHPELQRGPVQDEGEVRPAVVEHHDLVDHGQFQVRVRVVHGDAGVLGQEARPGTPPPPAPAPRPRWPSSRPRRPAKMPDSDTLPGRLRQRRQAQQAAPARPGPRTCTSRLAPMPSKAEPVSSAASTVKNRIRPEQVGQQDQVARRSAAAAPARRPAARASAADRRPPPGRPSGRRGRPSVVVRL